MLNFIKLTISSYLKCPRKGRITLAHNIYISAMTAILRDRINNLLTANGDLEREVARLRYAEAGWKNVISFSLIK